MNGSGSVKKKHYEYLDLFRIMLLISVFLYHLNILDGGYLAVCSFFALSGYLAVISGFKNKKFSFKDYYLSRLKKIYLPLLIVALITIGAISFISSINWINLKPESVSVFLGYNNYWQLNANLDYFVRHVSSPFMHLWYIAILLQFDLIFPFIFVLLKKIGNELKALPIVLLGALSAFSFTIFMLTLNNGNLMIAYYGTIERLFSLLLGCILGFIHVYFKPLSFKNINANRIIFIGYLIISTVLFVLIDADSNLFGISMLVTTILSMRLIDYSIVDSTNENKFDKVISYLSKLTYLFYLVQYPVIYIVGHYNIESYIRIPLIIAVSLLISAFVYYATNKISKEKVLKIIALIIVISISSFGAFKYVIAEDYTNEMNKLEDELNQNRLLIEEKQKEILEKNRQEEEEWEKFLNDLDKSEEELKEMVKNMYVVGIGDSVMELAVKQLYKQFPNGYFDGLTNRTGIQLNGIVKDLLDKNALGDVIVLNIGTNGGWSDERNEELIELIGDRKLFWINATNPDLASFNPNLIAFANKHDNVYIIDWISVIDEHPEYLIRDRVHPTVKGCTIYAETIYNAIYEVFLEEYNAKKEAIIQEHEKKKQNSITFVGNDLLIGLYNNLKSDYGKSTYLIDKNFDYYSLKLTLEQKANKNELSHNVVFVLDNNAKLGEREYNSIIDLYSDYNIYIVDLTNSINITRDNVTIIKLEDNEEYWSFDQVHLSDLGNSSLKLAIDNYLNK